MPKEGLMLITVEIPLGGKEAAEQGGRAVSPIRTPETTSGTIRSGNRQEEQKVLNIPKGPYLYGLFNTLQGFTRGHLDSKNL